MPGLTVAVAGVGRMGEIHVGNLMSSDAVAQVLVSDNDGDRANGVALRTGAAAASLSAALERADALVVATSSDAHAEVVRAGLRRRIPVFCEKPLSIDLVEAEELTGQIEAAATPFQLGFHRRSDPTYQRLREAITSGALGTIYLVSLLSYDPSPPGEPYIASSGGIFRDKGVHDYDLLRWLTGSEVVDVFALGEVRGFEIFRRYGDVDTIATALRMSNGILATHVAARHDPLGYDVRTEVLGSRDSVTVGLESRTPVHALEADSSSRIEPHWSRHSERFADAYRLEMETFLRVATGQATSPCGARDGVEALRVAIAAEDSTREHRSIQMVHPSASMTAKHDSVIG